LGAVTGGDELRLAGKHFNLKTVTIANHHPSKENLQKERRVQQFQTLQQTLNDNTIWSRKRSQEALRHKTRKRNSSSAPAN
jgi:hypothetical protein